MDRRLDRVPLTRKANAMNVALQQDSNVGVLLVNLGTPDTADTRGVRVYLREFLSDPRVIENQGLFWKLALNGVILQIRPRRKGVITARSGTPRGTSRRSDDHARAGGKLGAALDGSHIVVDGDALRQSVDQVGRRCVDEKALRPHPGRALYPQYSASTTATTPPTRRCVLQPAAAQPTVRFAPPY